MHLLNWQTQKECSLHKIASCIVCQSASSLTAKPRKLRTCSQTSPGLVYLSSSKTPQFRHLSIHVPDPGGFHEAA